MAHAIGRGIPADMLRNEGELYKEQTLDDLMMGREPYHRRQRGYLPNSDGGGIFLGSFSRLSKYLKQAFREDYAPIKQPIKNLKNAVYYGAMSWVWGVIDSATTGILDDVTKGFRDNYYYLARNHIMDFSPLMRMLTVGYGPGKTYINRMWVYKKSYEGKEYKIPIFFNTFEKPTKPTEDELKMLVERVDAELKSPFDDMGTPVSGNLINGDFMRFCADVYTGYLYNDYFQDELERIQRWFVKEDTKGSKMWKKDYAAEAELPPSVALNMEVYKKDVDQSGLLYRIGTLYGDTTPKSWKMACLNVLGDISQDVSYLGLGGAVLAGFLEKLGVEKEGIRLRMENVYKRGGRIHEHLGADRWLTYNIREETFS